MPALTITCELHNPSTGNYIVSAIDNVSHQPLLTNEPMGPDDKRTLTLVVEEDTGTGRMEYWADGYAHNTNDSVSQDDKFDLP